MCTCRLRRTQWIFSTIVLALSTVVPVDLAAQPSPPHEERRHDEMSDLAMKPLIVSPELPTPGERAEVRVTVENRASAAAKDVEVVIFANGRALGTRTVSIPSHSSQTVTVAWTAIAGAQTISAVFDPRHRLRERDRIDNVASIDLVVADAPPSAADFVLVSVEAIGLADRPSVLRVVVRNEGTARASAPVVIRRDGMPVRVVVAGPIDPAGTVTLEVPWSDPERGRVSAEVNPRFARAEVRPQNNGLARRRLFRSVTGSDLRVENLSFHAAHLEAGRPRTVGVTFRVTNDGERDITQPFRTRIDPGVIDAEGRARPFFVTTAALPAGGAVHVSHTIVSAPGDFTLTATVDVDGAVSESDETNNDTVGEFHNPAPDIDRWVSIGPRRITGWGAQGYGWKDASGRLSAIAIHPTIPATMYVGAQSGGVWKTTDGGVNWESVGESATVRIAALGLAPDNPSRVYLVTPRDGVYRSDDAGTSWLQISTQDLDAVVHGGVLLINPGNASDLLVATNQGVWRSLDGGATWQQTLAGGSSTGLVRMPSNSREVYAAIRNDGDASIAGVYRSLDSGGTWRAVTGCPGGALPAADSNTIIRLAVSGAELFVTYRQNDPRTFRLFREHGVGCSVGGLRDTSFEPGWTAPGNVDGGPIASVLWSGLWADPTDPNNLYLGGTYFWRSTDRGGSFAMTSGGGGSGAAHMDHHNVASDPLSPNVVYSLNDGGIYRSTSRGASGSWSYLGDGLANVEFYDHGSAPTRSSLVVGGTQDNGTLKVAVGETTVWTAISGGDGATVDVDPTDASIVYGMMQYAGSIRRSANEGGSFSAAASGLPGGSACFNLHFQVHPNRPATLLASCEGVWRTQDSGSSWTTIFTPATGAMVRTAIDGPADVYYAGSSLGVLFEGPGGGGWRSVFSHPTSMGNTDLEIDPDQRTVLYASFGGTGTGRVFRLVQNNATPAVFQAGDITSDLPVGRAVRTIAVDRNRSFTIYAGTEKGVFRGRSLDAGQTWFWTPYANGLPPADVRDLEVHPGTGVMRASTFGRSAYEVNTGHPMGSVLAAEGKLTFLRVHDSGGGFGPPTDFLDAEVIARLDSDPLNAFGFQLRSDASEHERRGLLHLLRDAFRRDQRIRIEYTRTGLRHGTMFRVIRVP